jgi:hypothetical protein
MWWLDFLRNSCEGGGNGTQGSPNDQRSRSSGQKMARICKFCLAGSAEKPSTVANNGGDWVGLCECPKKFADFGGGSGSRTIFGAHGQQLGLFPVAQGRPIRSNRRIEVRNRYRESGFGLFQWERVSSGTISMPTLWPSRVSRRTEDAFCSRTRSTCGDG